MIIRTLIVDDEPLARDRLRRLLGREPNFEVVAECATGAEAIEAILAMKPDLVFLDVEMPDGDGFDVVEAIGVSRMPVTVFVTGYEAFAMKAFEAHALDYLLKPFPEDRFSHTLARARKRVESGDARVMQQSVQAVQAEAARQNRPKHLAVRNGARIRFVDIESINWIQADGNYVRLHTAAGSHLIRDTISSLEGQLGSQQFLRIHRSTVVNLRAVKQLESLFKGEYLVLLTDGTKLTSSRPYRAALERALGIL